jgi:uroporphyrinogen decarboxylase
MDLMEWTSRDRFLAAMTHRVPDRVPRNLAFGLAPAQLKVFQERTGAQDPFDYFGIDTRMLSLELHGGQDFRIGDSAFYPTGPKQTELRARFRAYQGDLPSDATITEWGIAHLKTDAWHMTHMVPPLANIEHAAALEDFPFPEFDEPWRVQRFQEGVAALHARGLAVLGAVNPGLSAQAEYMCGQEKYWIGLEISPEYTETLLNKITQIRSVQARETARAGADVLFTAESLGSQYGLLISPRMWRYWYKERLRRIFDAAKEARPDILIIMYADGKFEELIPDLLEIGVNILGPAAPEYDDPLMLKEKYGDRLAFWGTISTQSTLPFEKPEQVRLAVKHMIERMGRGGGLCIGPTHRVMPEVPWENLAALYQAVDEYGRYEQIPLPCGLQVCE